jgi:hypothetical protein
VREAQKVEGLRATLPGSCSARGGEPPELDQPGLALVHWQPELLQPLGQCREELLSIRFVLTADRQIVRISTDDDLTGRAMSAPVVDPKIDDIVEEDVGEERADPRPLRRPDLHRFPSAMRRPVVVPRSPPPPVTVRWLLMGLLGSGTSRSDVTWP